MGEHSTIPARWHALHLAKRGNRPEEIEDALAASDALGRFAVADGVTDAIFSAVWARLLVDKFIAAPPTESEATSQWLCALREAWRQDVHQRSLPWYAEHKLATGAAATFAGLQIFPDNTWAALTVGDACLFHLRDAKLLRAFPINQSAAFNNRPIVLRSNPDTVEPSFERASGQWQPADQFALATDALAQWLLAEHERGGSIQASVQHLIAISKDQASVESDLNLLRDSHRLRNDDVVLLAVDV